MNHSDPAADRTSREHLSRSGALALLGDLHADAPDLIRIALKCATAGPGLHDIECSLMLPGGFSDADQDLASSLYGASSVRNLQLARHIAGHVAVATLLAGGDVIEGVSIGAGIATVVWRAAVHPRALPDTVLIRAVVIAFGGSAADGLSAGQAVAGPMQQARFLLADPRYGDARRLETMEPVGAYVPRRLMQLAQRLAERRSEACREEARRIAGANQLGIERLARLLPVGMRLSGLALARAIEAVGLVEPNDAGVPPTAA